VKIAVDDLTARSSPTPPGHVALARVLDRARLQVLRATVLIALLIAASNVAGVAPTGRSTDVATALGLGWCALWALAAVFPEVTARCFQRWQITAPALAAANAVTVGLTGGVESRLLAVCMYAGWIASVVVKARAALLTSLLIGVSVLVGYGLAGSSVADGLASVHRDNVLNSALLPVLVGLVGVMLATVTNAIFGGLGGIVRDLRNGGAATTPAMTALFAGRPVLLLDPPTRNPGARLSPTEHDVVASLAAGRRPKQIALQRGVAISTVRSQIKAAKRKSGARTIDELVAVAWDERT